MQLNRSTDYAIQMLLYLAKAGKTIPSSRLALEKVPEEICGVPSDEVSKEMLMLE
mgnify:CR=1 FL=1